MKKNIFIATCLLIIGIAQSNAQCISNSTTPHTNVTPGAAGTSNCATTADLKITAFNVTKTATQNTMTATITTDNDDDGRGVLITVII